MRTTRAAIAVASLLVAAPVWAQSATELRKELLQGIKKAQTDGKDVTQVKQEFDEGVKMINDGMTEEALEHFKKAKELMPK
ncbi:MAG: hypothetical protein U0807_08390 [Candidatus Binatia bacterium]